MKTIPRLLIDQHVHIISKNVVIIRTLQMFHFCKAIIITSKKCLTLGHSKARTSIAKYKIQKMNYFNEQS